MSDDNKSGKDSKQLPIKTGDHILTLNNTTILDVYENNFEEELYKIMELIDTYNVVAMDTEFPGINFQLTNSQQDEKDQEFNLIRENVIKQKIIQIGISIADENGNVPDGVSTWQFNFKFDEQADKISLEALNLLKQAGINFEKLKQDGINTDYFAEFFTASGILYNDDVKWIVFHGGFDFAYLLNILYGQSLPDSQEQFYIIMKHIFPNSYDIKYLVKDFSNLNNTGLSKLASLLNVNRIGPQHQAGSDSLLTLAAYFKLKKDYFIEQTQLDKLANIIYGIGKGYIKENYWNKNNYQTASNQNWQNSTDYDQVFAPTLNNNFYDYDQLQQYYYNGGQFQNSYAQLYLQNMQNIPYISYQYIMQEDPMHQQQIPQKDNKNYRNK